MRAHLNGDEDDVIEAHQRQRVPVAPPHRLGADVGEHDQSHVVMPGAPHADLELVHPEAGLRVPEAPLDKVAPRREPGKTVRVGVRRRIGDKALDGPCPDGASPSGKN